MRRAGNVRSVALLVAGITVLLLMFHANAGANAGARPAHYPLVAQAISVTARGPVAGGCRKLLTVYVGYCAPHRHATPAVIDRLRGVHKNRMTMRLPVLALLAVVATT